MKAGVCLTLIACLLGVERAQNDSSTTAPLPVGVKAVWDIGAAYRESTHSREKVCINGLWRWQPAGKLTSEIPAADWGWFKVPGSWPGVTDYMMKDSQTVIPHPRWSGMALGSIKSAWYEREFTIPERWSGRRITLSADCLNSHAAVYVDGKPVGEMRFPAGEVDLSAACKPGARHRLSMLVTALPLRAVMQSFGDSAAMKEVQGSVERRGLCGDVSLLASPRGPRIEDVDVTTSVRRWEVSFSATLRDLGASAKYRIRARVTDENGAAREFIGPPFGADALTGGRFTSTFAWKPEKLWDIHTPRNTHLLSLSLLDSQTVLDTAFSERFGFREFWIEGRDFYLNGSRIFLSMVPLDNAQISAAMAGYDRARESLKRLKDFGINFVYTHNYGCEPGSHLSFAEILRAADDVGMLVALSQPHFSAYDWKGPDADRTNGYSAHAAYYTNVAGNHPSVAAYSTSHNATGYNDDMNPDMIDGIQAPRDRWAENNSRLAVRAEAIIRGLDSSRIVYHHASGNLGVMHGSNFYPNFVPIQELSDWFERWARIGVKPAFLCEYGGPFTWDWTMYRGWYEGKREFGSARVPWEFCLAEWNAQFLGDRAYRITEMEKANLRWEARQFRAGNLWHRWDYPYQVGSDLFDDRHEVIGKYTSDNWRAYRTWGVSAISPWEHGHFWRLKPGVDKRRRELAVNWETLQRPGFSADYVGPQYERVDLAFERTDWTATASAQSLIRNNRPLLAYIAGKPSRFTSKNHNFHPGETVEKQIIVINNSREIVTADCSWTLESSTVRRGRAVIRVPTGQQRRVPIRIALPTRFTPGSYTLRSSVTFSSGEKQLDAFTVHVLAPGAALKAPARTALYDPSGETAAMLRRSQIRFTPVSADTDLTAFDVLILGKGALTVDGPAPDIRRVSTGLRVVLFEQTAESLEKRLGFRVAEYGLRQVFKRVADHPALNRLGGENIRDWRGESTILPARLKYTMRPMHGPTVKWSGIDVTRAWRCGNRGNVASVLIEKPAKGDFLPIVDGGYALQYSPLLEYREGRGMILFCQMDVTGRTEVDPAADILFRNLLQYAADWKPEQARTAVYAGDPAGLAHLQKAGLPVDEYAGGPLSSGQALVIGPGGETAAASSAAINTHLRGGGRLLALGLDEKAARACLPYPVEIKTGEHIAAAFDSAGRGSPLQGIGPADVHNRDPRELPLVVGGAVAVGNGVLAQAPESSALLCQLVPWRMDSAKPKNQKRTFRRWSFVVTRLLSNLGVRGATPLVERVRRPITPASEENRWLSGFYLDTPEEWDDPYRFFRW